MKNYKICVESEVESDEVQDLFHELGYKKGACSTGDYPEEIIAVIDSPFIKYAYSSRASRLNHERHKSFKKLTLAELQDMVVLKRNDINDATHTCNGHKYYLTPSEFFEYINGRWENVDEYVEGCVFEPIEKNMKEYLEPMPNGDYRYHKDDGISIGGDWIEIPEGADTLVALMYFKSSSHFFKTIDKLHVWSEKSSCWGWSSCENIQHCLGDHIVLWERNKEVKTDSSLEFEISTGSQLDVIGSKIYGARSRIKGETDVSYREYLRSLTRFNSVEYPKDRRIKYFEKFLNGEKIQYRIGIAVGSDNSQWHNLTWNSLKDMKNTLIEFREAPKYVTLNGVEFKTVESLLKHVKNNYDLGD